MYNVSTLDEDMKNLRSCIYETKMLHIENKVRVYAELRDISNTKKIIGKYHALNEVVVDRGPSVACIRIDIYCNDIYLTELMGDGVIISTPTGSTAYSLSAGGPIIQNSCKVMSIVPICPFSLSFRPVCLPTCSVIKIRVSKDSRSDAYVSWDG